MQVTIEATRPFSNYTREVDVPGATKLSLVFDPSTNTTSADQVWISNELSNVRVSCLAGRVVAHRSSVTVAFVACRSAA